jgi:hypothetical protein
MALIPNGRRRVQGQAALNYQGTGFDGSEVSQDVATPAPETSGPATDFGQLQQQLEAPQEQPSVPDMGGLNSSDQSGGIDSDNVSAFRNELIDALSQVSVDPERARLVAKRALTIGYKNPQEDILSGEFLVPAKDEVPITQVKSVFAPIIDKHGFVLTSLKPHQNSGKSGKKVVDYWKLEFETMTEDPNEQQVEGDYSDMLDASDLQGDQQMPRAAESQHSLIRNARSKLLDFMLEELARKGEV